ncbi:hypothetical protein J1N35_038842 [Gossypium stocksii]|uniref:Uncharacterized protein n=1 Tax=Gossypium stocksii TaxID=47602 RepID=A0A9D3UML6_9ROSI|nr:hypothetical protein J1N35_038842 [Gossypium stocksii]
MEENGSLQKSLKWLKGLSKGYELEALTLEGLLIVDAQKGSIRYNFVVSSRVSQKGKMFMLESFGNKNLWALILADTLDDYKPTTYNSIS